MPAFELSDVAVKLTPYDVVASGAIRLPTHAMLYVGENTRADVNRETPVPVSHMRPPLADNDEVIHFVGSAELTTEERRLVKDFVDTQRRAISSLRLRQKIEQYAIHCDNDEIHPGDTLPRYSCATYVSSAYEQAAIQLLDNLVPLKTIDDLKALYTDQMLLNALDNSEQRVKIGIGNGTSWPIVMVGYLLHSLSRDPALIRSEPYKPLEGDEYFPRDSSG